MAVFPRYYHLLLLVGLVSWTGDARERCLAAELIDAARQQEALVPHRDIAYATSEVPKWKAVWDTARELSRSHKFKEALSQFTTLLENKPNLDEARWEYTSILLHLERWGEAETQLDILQAEGRENPAYTFARAEIALHTDNLTSAVKLYSKLYVQFTGDDQGVKALDGLTQALIAQGKSDIALPLVEQLLLRRPNEITIKRRAALVMAKVGKVKQAALIFADIYPDSRQDVEVLNAYSAVLTKRGKSDQAASILQEIYSLTPEDPKVNRILADYYRDQGNAAMELRHLEPLVGTAMQPRLIKRVISLNLSLGRIDKALQICNANRKQIAENKPLDLLYRQVLASLARDLLALVENNGAEMLWKDLQSVTNDRLEVFINMASILRKQGKVNELADVLLVVASEISANDPLRHELETLLISQGRIDELVGLN